METGQEDAIGLYINYLQVGKLIIFPQFDCFVGDNEKALNIISKAFPPAYQVVPFEAGWIARFGGYLIV